MKKGKTIVLLVAIIFFHSCSKDVILDIKEVTQSNDEIQGQIFKGEDTSSSEYHPVGGFILIEVPFFEIWSKVLVEKNNVQIAGKQFFLKDSPYTNFLYDSLVRGTYQLKFISDLNDTISTEIDFKNSINVSYPEIRNAFYDKQRLKKFSLDKMSQNDTLQLLYREAGCFDFTVKLFEFYHDVNDELVLREQVYEDVFRYPSKYEWIHTENMHIRKKLKKLIANLQMINQDAINQCSSEIEYIFSLKGSQTIYSAKEKNCNHFLHQFLEDL